jgi:hypothetical protein
VNAYGKRKSEANRNGSLVDPNWREFCDPRPKVKGPRTPKREEVDQSGWGFCSKRNAKKINKTAEIIRKNDSRMMKETKCYFSEKGSLIKLNKTLRSIWNDSPMGEMWQFRYFKFCWVPYKSIICQLLWIFQWILCWPKKCKSEHFTSQDLPQLMTVFFRRLHNIKMRSIVIKTLSTPLVYAFN